MASLAAAAMGVCILSTVAPAQAAPATDAATDPQVTVGSAVGLYITPRLNTPTTGQLYAGDQARAYCTIANDGIDWVKIQLNAETRFIQRSGVASGAENLPTTCPNEVETVERPAFAMTFGAPAWGVPLGGFTCPTSYPFLDERVKGNWTLYFDNPFSVDLFAGLKFERPIGIGVDLGAPLWVTAADGESYLSGYAGGTVSNHYGWNESLLITATCTSNLAHAKKSSS